MVLLSTYKFFIRILLYTFLQYLRPPRYSSIPSAASMSYSHRRNNINGVFIEFITNIGTTKDKKCKITVPQPAPPLLLLLFCHSIKNFLLYIYYIWSIDHWVSNCISNIYSIFMFSLHKQILKCKKLETNKPLEVWFLITINTVMICKMF